MPQMSPISWINLITIMTVTMLIVNSTLYFKPNKNLLMKKKKTNKKEKNWKW